MVYTCLFYQIHKSGSKTPRFVSVALQRADSHLGGTLGGHCYHVNSIVHQSCFSLHEKTETVYLMYVFVAGPSFSPLRTIPSGYCYGKGHYWAFRSYLRCKTPHFLAAYINFRVFSGGHWEENYVGLLQEEKGRWVQCRKKHTSSSVERRGVLRSLRWYSSPGLTLQACLRAKPFAVSSLP